MPLTIINGPPNSGRTERIRREYLELLRANRNPVLVVPGVNDIFGWERRLTDGSGSRNGNSDWNANRDRDGDSGRNGNGARDGNGMRDGALVGGQILHFKDLYSEILSLAKTERPEVAGEIRRLQMVREAIRSGWREIARRLPEQPGLAESVLELIDDFRAENVDPDTLASRVAEPGRRHLKPLADVYRGYVDGLDDGSGITGDAKSEPGSRKPTDFPNEARLAVERVTDLWRSRPVMIVGFDELTRQQLEMIRRLAFKVGVQVTIAITYEPDNPALNLTAELFGTLLHLGPPTETSFATTHRGEVDRPHHETLLEVERRFMRRAPDRGAQREDPPLTASEAVTVMRSTGSRNEAEAIAAEIARLVADDVPPQEIAVAIEAPARQGRILRDTLERLRIPVTLEAETGASETVTGQAVLNLLRACGPAGSATALLAFLRSPAGLEDRVVDELESELRTGGIESASAALDRLAAPPGAAPLPRLADLAAKIRGEQPIAEVIADAARQISLTLLAADHGPTPSAATTIETKMGSAIARACRQIGELTDAREQPAAVIEALESGLVTVWAVPAVGTVRIASPYSLRAKRVGYLFCASLQESGLVDRDRAGPFLSVQERTDLGMSARRDPEAQQRYLFYSSLSVPTERLWLSCRTADETGKAEYPSPLIDAVEELFEKDPEARSAVGRGGRGGSEVVFLPADAADGNELARSLAALGYAGQDLPAGLELEEDLARTIVGRLDAASAAERRSRRIASLTLPAILGELADHPILSATGIEAYAGCPYRWFIERQLNPQPFEPDPDYLATGNLIHAVLENLYLAHPGEIPREATLQIWLEETQQLVAKHSRSPRIGLGSDSASHRALRNRINQLLQTHLRREAGWENPRHLPAMLEARFGTSKAETGAVEMGEWALNGKIDRIDLSPETPTGIPREAVVIDYKSGSVERLTWKNAERDRRLQVQLYLHAVRELFGVTPVAGLYVPIRADGKSARGAFADDVAGEMKARGVPGTDATESLDRFVEDGVQLARESVARMMAGLLDHDPATCPNHFDHPAVPDRSTWDDIDGGAAS